MPITLSHESRSAISRARFFLDKAKVAAPESRVEFEAFLEAAIVFARAALHRFKTNHEHHPAFKSWWNDLLKDDAVNFFRSERDRILKEAPPRIGQKLSLPHIGPARPESEDGQPSTAGQFYYFEQPDTPATNTIEKHLDHLDALLEGARARFA